jgi:hypothetical protein
MKRRSPLALAPIAPAAATLAIAVILSSCASSGAASGARPANLSYGYLIPGADVAGAFGVNATDTLPELAATATVPTALSTAITQEVRAGNWNNRCTRRFGGPTTYAVIFHRVCDSSAGPEADPQVIVGFGADGRKKGTVRWSGSATVSALVPARRF